MGEGMYTGDLPAGTHKLVITREGYQRFEEEVVLAEKETSSRTVVLTLSSVVKTGGVPLTVLGTAVDQYIAGAKG